MWVQGTGFGFSRGSSTTDPDRASPAKAFARSCISPRMTQTADPLFPPGGPPTPVTRIRWAPTMHCCAIAIWARRGLPAICSPPRRASGRSRASQSRPRALAGIGSACDCAAGSEWLRCAAQSALSLRLRAHRLPGFPTPTRRSRLRRRSISPGVFRSRSWIFSRSLLNADALEPAFTVDPVAWRAIAWGNDGRPTQQEIDGDQGTTIRFGDGSFGAPRLPRTCSTCVIASASAPKAMSRRSSITSVDPAWSALVASARNPFPVTDGADAESAEHVRRMAPQAFVPCRYMRPESYEAAAESLPWVQKAGTSFRWTGSWLTVFTAVDPKGTEQIALRRAPAADRAAQPAPAGRLRIPSAAAALRRNRSAHHGLRLAGVAARRRRARCARPARQRDAAGWQHRFLLRRPLHVRDAACCRSRLEAAIQAVPGVKGVLSVTYRRRGSLVVFIDLPEVLPLGPPKYCASTTIPTSRNAAHPGAAGGWTMSNATPSVPATAICRRRPPICRACRRWSWRSHSSIPPRPAYAARGRARAEYAAGPGRRAPTATLR